MKLNDLSAKICAVKEMQQSATELLNGVSQDIADNKLLSDEDIGALTGTLSLLVALQVSLTDEIADYLGDNGADAVAKEYQKLLGGDFSNAIAQEEVDRFLTITSDDGEYKKAITEFQEEVKRAMSAAKIGELLDLVAMINRAVESEAGFSSVKDELRAQIRVSRPILYSGLLERSYRFAESAEDTAAQPENLPEKVKEAEKAEEEIPAAPERAPAEVSASGEVEWVCYKSEFKTAKCVGDFIVKRNGRSFPIASRSKRLFALQLLYYFGCLTEETFAKNAGKDGKDWLLRQGYISECKVAGGKFNVVTVSAKGLQLLNNGEIFFLLNRRPPQKEDALIGETFGVKDERTVLDMLAVGEVAAATYDTVKPNVHTIDFKYNLVIYEIEQSLGRLPAVYGLSICSKSGLSGDCMQGIEDFNGGRWVNSLVINCDWVRADSGELLAISAFFGNKTLFTLTPGEDCAGVEESVKPLLGVLLGVEREQKTIVGAHEEIVEEPAEEEIELPVEEEAEETAPEDGVPETREGDEPSEGAEEIEIAEEDGENLPVQPEERAEECAAENTEAETEVAEVAEVKSVECDDGSARCLADKIINDGLLPETSADDYVELMDRLICEKRDGVAMALGYSLRADGDTFGNYYECLKHALGYGLDALSAELTDLPVSELSMRRRLALQACAYARAFIKAEAVDYTALSGAKSLRDYEWENLTAWKNAYVALLEAVDKNRKGFSPKILGRLTDDEQKDKMFAELRGEAKKLLESSSWPPNDQSTIFREAFKRAFGPKTEIYMFLESVASDEKSAAGRVEEFLKDFYATGGGFDDQKIQEFRYKVWDEQGGKERLTSKIGNNFDKKCLDRLELLEKWAGLTHSSGDKSVVELRRRKDELIIMFKKAADSDGTAEGALFAKTAAEIAAYLGGKDVKGGDFTEFFMTESIALDGEGYRPVLEDFSEEVPALRAYYRIAEHVALDRKEGSAEELFRERIGEDNFGMAAVIAAYYGVNCDEPDAKARALANNDFNKAYNDISTDLDMAYTRGLVDENFLSKRKKEAENIFKSGESSGNYGLCAALFTRFSGAIDLSAAAKKQELNKRFDSLQQKKAEGANPIFESIRSQIDAGNYTVAEEYLTRAEGGEKEVEDTVSDEFDAHADFFEKYDALFKYCQEYDGKTLDKMAQNIDDKINEKNRAELCLSDNAENNDMKAGRIWLRALPAEGWLPGAPQHKNQFLTLLNFTVVGYKRIKDGSSDFIDEYTITPTKQNLPNYAHPISRFGTRLEKLNLFYINGKKGGSVGELIKNRQGDFTSDAVIVYLDSAIGKETRRKIAKDIKTQKSPRTFLVIDRVLALYLAFTKQAGRLSSMLKCTLPYTDFNPYCTSGAGSVDSEMFMGRERERNDISNMNSNTYLVCGGRQLGKTVLLERVGETMHDPSARKFAIYTGTRGDGSAAVLKNLVREIKEKCGLLEEKAEIRSWDDLKERCVKLYRDKKYQSLIVFIDEGDAFIEEQKKCGYKALETLNAVRKSTKNAFKFVLAGLHNISRESHDDNGFLAQLGSPLIIKPFTMREAKQLVEVPLLYLGFKFEQPDRLLPLILSHTNYYPGLLHLFCSDLINHLTANFTKYFNEIGNPPYIISEEHVKAVVTNTEFKDRVKATFEMTLKLQSDRYKKIALALAVLYLEKPSHPGYTADEIKKCADGWSYAEDLSVYHNLLTEMCDLGMLVEIKSGDGLAPKYVFLRQAFFGYVCNFDTMGRRDKDDQLYALLGELEKIGKEARDV